MVVSAFCVVSKVLGSWVGRGCEDIFCLFPVVVKGEADSNDPVVSCFMELVVEFKGGPSESALITVTNTTVQRNTARRLWEAVRTKPTEDTAEAIVPGRPVKASHPCVIPAAATGLLLPVITVCLKSPIHVEPQDYQKMGLLKLNPFVQTARGNVQG